ncbi:MAG: hypothetical protein JWM89_3512 [Acidimicrobiales bacterium]|nr:hypothetical protein [Acidimicrobiales bacterium]
MTSAIEQEHADLLSTRSTEAARQGGTEADLRHHLWLFFQPWATRVLGLDQAALSHEGTGLAGRYDSRIGRAIVEYKIPGSLESAKAREAAALQALKYIEDSTMAADVVIVTDGSTWAHYRDASAPLEMGEQGMLQLAGIAPPATSAERFTWRGNGPESCARILNLIDTVRTDPVTGSTIAARLGLARPEVLELIGAMARAVADREPDGRTDTLLRQWIQLAGVSYGITSSGDPWPSNQPIEKLLGDRLAPVLKDRAYAEALFSLHTYVALAAKLIGTELLSLGAGASDKRPTSWVSLPPDEMVSALLAMEDGTTSTHLRSPGLMAGDLFGWYAHLLSDDPALAESVRSLLRVFGELAWARVTNSARGIAGDLLRDFYGAVVPRPLRRALGEFFTPQWLAERTLTRAIELAGGNGASLRVLDPSCGSGTFLVAALSRELVVQDALHPSERGKAALQALGNVIGFDINPVAVLMARINLLLALGDRIETLTSVTPQVFQADSILLPDPIRGEVELHQQGDFRRLPLAIGNVDVPSSLASLGGLHSLRENIERGVESGRTALTFRMRLEADLDPLGLTPAQMDETLEASALIYEQILELHKHEKDGVWARIIEQAFAPATIGPVDLVIGNPPWISWKHLPQSWQERSRSLWLSWGLWAKKGKGGGIPLADIATLLVARSIVSYAKEGAIVAFLLPESFLIADPGNERMRRCRLQQPDLDQPSVRFQPLAVDDWTAIKPFSPDAANLPIALYLSAGREPSWPIPKDLWTRSVARAPLPSDHHWGQVASRLVSTAVEISPAEPRNMGSPWVQSGSLKLLPKGDPISYTWGQGFHTRGLDGYFVYEILSSVPDPSGLVLVRNVPTAGDNTRAESPREGVIEAKFLWPLVRGQNVERFRIETSGLYALLPHHPDDVNRFLSLDELIRFGPHLFDYLETWISRLAARSPYGKLQPSMRFPWGVLGPTEHLAREKPVVLARYMHPKKRPPVGVSYPTYDPKLGFTTSAYPNNKSNVHVPTSEDEARYIEGWMNSEVATDAISRLASSTTIGPTTLHRLPIPRFDPAEPSHRAIVSIALAGESGIAPDGGALDAAVLESVRARRL